VPILGTSSPVLLAWTWLQADAGPSGRRRSFPARPPRRESRPRVPPVPAELPNLALVGNQGGACGAAGPASAPGLSLGRPPGRTPGQHARTPADGPAHRPAHPHDAMRPHCHTDALASCEVAHDWPTAATKATLSRCGSLIRSRLCSPPGQAGQGQLRCRRCDGASATLDSPALPGGFRQLSDEAPLSLS
jgi:hypothetical protein